MYKTKHQVLIISAMVALAYFLTYYFQTVLQSKQLYTHFFYIPIILSCMWWKRKGLYVTGALLLALIINQLILFRYTIDVDVFFRALMLLFVSLITVLLSEDLLRTKEQLVASEVRYRKIFETTGTAMVIIDKDATISLVNNEFENLSGYSKAELENQKNWLDFVHQEEYDKIRTYHFSSRASSGRAPHQYEFKFATKSNEHRDVLATVDMIPGTQQSIASFSDITELKQTLKRQKELQTELSTALAKALSGFIPICANCKKIRDEQDQWIQLESFLSMKTAAAFSHGICPDCAKQLYGQIL